MIVILLFHRIRPLDQINELDEGLLVFLLKVFKRTSNEKFYLTFTTAQIKVACRNLLRYAVNFYKSIADTPDTGMLSTFVLSLCLNAKLLLSKVSY